MSHVEKQAVFGLNKLRRVLAVNGKMYSFLKQKVDKFGTPIGEPELVVEVKGLYHDSFGGFVTEHIGETSRTVRKYQPMVMVLLEDSALLDNSCFVMMNGARYDVKSIKDVNNMGYAADVSLEAVN